MPSAAKGVTHVDTARTSGWVWLGLRVCRGHTRHFHIQDPRAGAQQGGEPQAALGRHHAALDRKLHPRVVDAQRTRPLKHQLDVGHQVQGGWAQAMHHHRQGPVGLGRRTTVPRRRGGLGEELRVVALEPCVREAKDVRGRRRLGEAYQGGTKVWDTCSAAWPCVSAVLHTSMSRPVVVGCRSWGATVAHVHACEWSTAVDRSKRVWS